MQRSRSLEIGSQRHLVASLVVTGAGVSARWGCGGQAKDALHVGWEALAALELVVDRFSQRQARLQINVQRQVVDVLQYRRRIIQTLTC